MRRLRSALAFAGLMALAQLGVAQTTYYWDGDGTGTVGGGTGTWSTGLARWSTTSNGNTYVAWNNTAPTDYAIFGGTAGTVTWSTNISVRRITFTTTGYTLQRSAGTFTLDTDGWIDTQANTATITGPMAGTVGLTKLGTGTLILSGANTYTGVTNISQGVLNIQNAAALGSTTAGNGTTVAGTGAALELQGGIAVGAEALTLNGTGISTGGALRNISGSNSYAGAITLGSASRINSDAGTLTLTGGVTGTFQLNVGGAGDTTVNTSGINNGALLVKDGAGTLTVGASSNFTKLQLSGGTYSTNMAAGTLGAAPGAFMADNLIFDGGRLLATASGTFNTNRGATLNANTSSNLSAANGFSITYGAVMTGSGNIAFGGVDTGTVVLSGANTYTGVTTVGAGILSVGTIGNGGVAGNLGQATSAAANIVLDGGTLRYTGSAASSNRLFTLGTAGGTIESTTGALTLNGVGSVAFTGTGSRTLTLGGANGGSLTAVLGDADGSSATSLAKAGAGTWTLAGANTFTGATSIAATGTLNLTNPMALQNSTLNYAAAGGTVTFTGITAATLGGLSGDKALSLTNAAAAALALTVGNNNASTTYSGILSGAGSLIKVGSGTTTLSGVNTYTGVTTVSGGVLSVGTIGNGGVAGNLGQASSAAANLVLNGGTLRYTGAAASSNRLFTLGTSGGTIESTTALLTLNGVGSVAFTGTGARTLTLGGASNGSLTAVLGDADGSSATSLVKADAGTWTLAGANTFTGGTSISAGTLNLTNSLALQNSTLNYAAAGGTVTFTGITAATLGGLSGDKALTLTNAAAAALALTVGNNNASTTYSGILSGAGSLIKVGSGTTTLSGANSYTGATTVNNGTLRAGSTTAFGNGSAVTVNATTAGTTATLDLNGSSLTIGSLTFGGANATATSTNVVQTGAGTLTLGGNVTYNATNNPLGATLSGNLALGASRIFTIGESGNAADDLTVSAVISGSGFGLDKQGAGTLRLDGANTFSGVTTITAGSLNLTNSLALQNSTLNYTASGNNVTFTGITAATLGGLSGDKSLALTNAAAAALALSVGNNNASTTYSGILSGAGSLIKTGDGTLTLTGANTYTGVTTVSAGVLNVQNASALGSTASGTTVSAGALELQGGVAVGSEALTLNGAGISGGGALRSVSGANSYAGAITLNSASRVNADAGSTLTLAGGVTGTGLELTVGGAGNTVFNTTGINTSTGGSLVKDGSGTLTLNASGNLTGGATVYDGTLKITTANALGSGGLTLSPSSASGSATFDFAHNNATGAFSSLTFGGAANSTSTIINTGGNPNSRFLLGGTLVYDATNNPGTASITSKLDLNGGTQTFQIGDSSNTSTEVLISGAIQNGSIVKTGAGTLELSAANTFTDVSVNAGTVRATSSASALGAGALTLAGGVLELANNTGLNFGRATTVTSSSTIISDRGAPSGAGVTHTLGTLSIGAQTLTLAAGSNVNSGTAGLTFGATTLTAGGAVFAPGAGTLLTLGNVTGTNTGFSISGAGDATVSGVIATGTGSLTKGGAGALTLSGASSNTFTGTTTVTGGTLVLAKTSSATALAGNLVIGDTSGSATVQLNASNQIAPASTVTFTAGGTPVLNLNGYSQTLGSIATSTASAQIQFGSGGTRNLTVGGDNSSTTYAGTFTSGDAAATLIKQGTGTLTLTGNSSGFSGATSITAGVLNAQNNNALGTGNVTVSSGATLQLQGSGVQLGSGSATVTLNGSGTGSGGNNGALINVGGATTRLKNNVVLGSDTTISSGATNGALLIVGGNPPAYTIGVSAPDNNTVTLGSNKLTFVGDAGTTTRVDSNITGAGSVDINTAGTVNYNANKNTYTGATNVLNGTLIVNTANNNFAPNSNAQTSFWGISGPLVIGDNSGAANSATVKLGTAAGVTNNAIKSTQPITINSDGYLNLNSNSQNVGKLTMSGGTIAGGTLYLDYANTSVDINPTATSGTSVINGELSLTFLKFAPTEGSVPNQVRTFNVGHDNANISDLTINALVGTGSLVKEGVGTMVLATSNNTYEGSTTVNNGILNIRVGTENVSGANRSSLGVGDSNNSTGAGTTVNSGGTLQLQGGLTMTHEQLTLNGTGFGGIGALNNLSGNNTWGTASTGGITLGSNARVTSTAGLLTLASTISSTGGNNFSLNVDGPGDTTISGNINTGGTTSTLTKTGDGTLTLTGSNGYQGATYVQQGVVSVQSNTGLGAASSGANGTFVTAGAELQLSNVANGNLTIGAEALSINGTGVGGEGALRNIAGSNSFSGVVTLATPSLISANAGSTLTLSGGITSSSQNLTVSTTSSTGAINVTGATDNGSGSLTKNGASTVTFSGATTTFGEVNMNGGTLKFDSPATTLGAINMNAGSLQFNGATTPTNTTAGQVFLNGGTMSVSSVTTLNTAEFAASGGAGSTLTIASGGLVKADYTAANTVFSGAMAGAGTFEKAGSGTLTFDYSFAAPNLTLQIDGGTLALTNGVNLEFGTIHITGNTILDFGLSTATVLRSSILILDPGVSVTVNNWVSLSDAWYVTTSFYQNGGPNSTLDTTNQAPQNQITFAGYSNTWSAWVTTQGGQYFEHELRPIPEPSTYGLIFFASSLGLLGARRLWLQRRQKAAATPPAKA